MIAPPDIQISSLLYFLGTALRADDDIQRLTEARPSEIVNQTVEYQPMMAAGGQVHVLISQMPALALHVVSERPRIVPGTHHGREITAWLWYLFQPFQAEDRDMHGFTKGSRLSTLIWWRLQYYLKHQTLPPCVASDDVTFDLQSVSGIRTVEMLGESDRLEFDKVEGFRQPLKIWHGEAPYAKIPPATLDLIQLGITAEAGSGVGVSADVDVSAP